MPEPGREPHELDASDVVGATGDAQVAWQGSLFAGGPPAFDAAYTGLGRVMLDETSWVDHLPRWLEGSDDVFAELVARLPWRQRTVPMYDRMVQEPRLVWWWTEADGPAPLAVLDEVVERCRAATAGASTRSAATTTARAPTAWPGTATGCATSRSTRWSPSSASARLGRSCCALAAAASRCFLLGQGDLLVMGGATQHDWEHAVPKVAAAGPASASPTATERRRRRAAWRTARVTLGGRTEPSPRGNRLGEPRRAR